MNRRQLLTLATLAAVVFALPLTLSFGAEPNPDAKKAKVLYFSRSQGFEHGPVKLLEDGTTVSGVALKKYCDAKNIELVCTQDGGVFDGDLGQFDGFVFYTSGNLEEENGSKNPTAHAISADGLKKFFAAVKSGKGLVGIHSGSDTHCKQKDEKGLDLFTKLIGARFASHGPMQDATVSIVKPVQLPWLKDKGEKYTTFEEWYAMKDYNPDMHVVLVQETAGMNSGKGNCYDRPNFPSSWIRMEEKGRVAYSAFGHDNKFWKEDDNVKKIGEMIEWSLGRFDMDTTPNFETVTPQGNQMPK